VQGITWYIDLFTFGFLLPGGQAYFFAPTDHSKDGSYKVCCYAEDNAGNHEGVVSLEDRSMSFGIDTRKPTTSAPYSTSARRGTTAALKYKVKETGAHGPKANTVTIKVHKSGVLKKTLTYTNKAVNTVQIAKFTVPRPWKTGTYVFKVYATDDAGNAQASVGSNKLVVKQSRRQPAGSTSKPCSAKWRSKAKHASRRSRRIITKLTQSTHDSRRRRWARGKSRPRSWSSGVTHSTATAGRRSANSTRRPRRPKPRCTTADVSMIT